MHYEINVSLNGQHFFGTHKRSLTNERQAKEVFHAISKAFPATKGYEVTIQRIETVGYDVTEDYA